MEEEARQTKKKAETRRDQLRAAASQLISFGMTADQATSLISNYDQETINTTIEALKSRGGVRPQEATQFLGETPAPSMNLEEAISTRTTPTARPVAAVETRGAFGLPSRSGAEFAEKASTLKTELPESTVASSSLDFSVLMEESSDTLDKRINRASIRLLDAETEEDRETAKLELNQVLAVKALQQKEAGGVKEADVRANYRILNNSIMESLAGPGELVRDTETGSLMYSRAASPEVRNRIEQQKRKAFMESPLTKSYRLSDGTLPEEVSRVINSFTYAAPASKQQPAQQGDKPAPSPVPAEAPAQAAQAQPRAPASGAIDKQQTIQNARAAAKKINESTDLSRGQKNGKLSIIRQRLTEAGIDPKEAGL
jgi:hypothetical protein